LVAAASVSSEVQSPGRITPWPLRQAASREAMNAWGAAIRSGQIKTPVAWPNTPGR
jgi:hypothetical protein